MIEEIKHEDIAAKPKPTPPAKSTAKKRALKTPKVVDSDPEMSSEDDFDPENDGSPVAKKRRCTELTFAESAAATAALKSPPPRRATRGKSLPDPATPHRERSPSLSEADIRKSVGVRPSEISFEEMLRPRDRIDELMRAHGVGHYDEHLLARQQPVTSNPVALIPPIIERGGAPRRQPDETYARIQEQVRAKLSGKEVEDHVKYAQEETARNLAEQKVSDERETVR
jgi:hypothetical protein